jgi:hypothetical protein
MTHTFHRAFCYCTLVVIAAAASSALAQKARVVGPIEGNREVVLQQHVHPLARPEFDRGAADAAMKLDYVTMVLKPTGDSADSAAGQVLGRVPQVAHAGTVRGPVRTGGQRHHRDQVLD